MQKTVIIKLLSLLFALVLFVGCSSNQLYADEPPVSSANSSTATKYPKPIIKLGQGRHSFNLIITHLDGAMQLYTIRTDKKIVGEALVDLGLITMGNDDYGLHIKSVDGVTLDAEKDGKCWFFIIDANQAASVMQTEVSAAEEYFMLQPK